MDALEKAVRDAAEQLKVAAKAAVEAGYHILWPRHGEDITTLAISSTGNLAAAPAPEISGTVTNLDGSPIERDADGVAVGEPLNLTDEERSALPPLGEADPNEPPVMGFASFKGAPEA